MWSEKGNDDAFILLECNVFNKSDFSIINMWFYCLGF